MAQQRHLAGKGFGGPGRCLAITSARSTDGDSRLARGSGRWEAVHPPPGGELAQVHHDVPAAVEGLHGCKRREPFLQWALGWIFAIEQDGLKPDAVAEMEWVKQFILGIRQIKGEMNIAPGKPVPVLLSQASVSDKEWAEKHRAYLDFLARTESIEVLPEGDEGPESATALVGEMKLLIPLSGLIDRDAELARLEKELGKLKAEADRVENKLSNPNFVDKAPEAVVQKKRDKLAEAKSAMAKLEEQAERIKSL